MGFIIFIILVVVVVIIVRKEKAKSDFDSDMRAQRAGDAMKQAVLSGHSCIDCKGYYGGYCPFEDRRADTPNPGGIPVCHRWEAM